MKGKNVNVTSSLIGFAPFERCWEDNATLAWDTIAMRSGVGIPTWIVNDMQWSHLDTLSGNPPGSYENDPIRVYREFQLAAGCCFMDQWIPENPLSMKDQGYETEERGAATGADVIERNGIVIASPEAVVEHMETHLFPQMERAPNDLELLQDVIVRDLISGEVETQRLLGMNMLKGPYSGFFSLPSLLYGMYGYINYFMAYALYPEVMERCIQPLLDADIRLIWHCDGNLMDMLSRLLECGLGGFQGFQYEDGMDYEKICRMKTRDGDDLLIIAGVSVTTTLPHGTPSDIRGEMEWLVETGPKTGLMLGCSSSIAPGVPLENIKTLIAGFAHYRHCIRGSLEPK